MAVSTLRRALRLTAPVVTAKVVKEGRRFVRILRRTYAEVKAEKEARRG